MPRRGDPERIYQAQRAGIFARLVREARLDRFDAEQWIVAWEVEAEAAGIARRSPGFWDEGWHWIQAMRKGPSE